MKIVQSKPDLLLGSKVAYFIRLIFEKYYHFIQHFDLLLEIIIKHISSETVLIETSETELLFRNTTMGNVFLCTFNAVVTGW